MKSTKPSTFGMLLAGIALPLLRAFAFPVVHVPAPLVRYVAPGGSNTNPGTRLRPFRTISFALRNAVPGETIFVRRGVYAEHVELQRSGSAARGYITLRNYPGEHPIIDGYRLRHWLGSLGIDALIAIEDASYVRVVGLELRGLKTSSANIVAAGIFVSGSGSHIELLNNHIHNISTSVKTAEGNAFGIAVYGTRAPQSISDLLIDGNELDHLVTGSSESLTINGNVQHFTITRNTVHDNNNIGIDAIGFEQTSPNPTYDQARDGIISCNLVYNISSAHNPAYGINGYGADGIYVDGGTRIVISRNIVHNCDIGVEMASEHHLRFTSFIDARSNLIFANNSTGVSVGGASTQNGGTRFCTVFNNTLYHNDSLKSGNGEVTVQYNAAGCRFANNIIDANEQGILISSAGSASIAGTFNYNLYHAPRGVVPHWNWLNHSFITLNAFRYASNQETKGLFSDPLFINSSADNLMVQPISPAINRGEFLTARDVGERDVAGHSRTRGGAIDLGAYEHDAP